MVELLSPDGRTIDLEWDWLFHAMASWLDDRTVRDCILKANIASPFHLGALRKLIHGRLTGKPIVDARLVKQAAHDFLGDRNTRRRIARATHRDQERQMAAWAVAVDAWLRTPEGKDPGPKPQRPDRPNMKMLLKGLLDVRAELAKDLGIAAEVAQPQAG